MRSHGEGLVGGAILFARNLTSLEQLRPNYSVAAPARGREPLWLLAIDQEGGRVQRLRAPFRSSRRCAPSATFGERPSRGARDDPRRSLQRVGITQNYAPVLDVDSNPKNPIIGDRSFSRDPAVVARLASAFIDGLQVGGHSRLRQALPWSWGHERRQPPRAAVARRTIARASKRSSSSRFAPRSARASSPIMTAHIVFPAPRSRSSRDACLSV